MMYDIRQAIEYNYRILKERVAKAAERVGRSPSDIVIVAATKTVPPEKIKIALELGIRIIGENRVQEALQKKPLVGGGEWHMIGHLQRNKVKKALQLFDCIQSVDSLRLAEEINKRASSPVRVFVEVNTSGEPTKYGVSPDEAIDFVCKVAELPNLKVEGLMTIGPLHGDPRPAFRTLRQIGDKLNALNIDDVHIKYLSMGMSDDFEIAIEEGSNMIRIGRALFGPRTT